MRRNAMTLPDVVAVLIAVIGLALIAMTAWRGHPKQQFRRTLAQIRALPEHHRERSRT